MHIHIIGNKGIVGSANEKTLLMSKQHEITGSDKNEELYKEADIFLICVPEQAILSVLKKVHNLKGLPVIRSTVRPDIIQSIKQVYIKHFCINPEFLKAHTAFWDCYFPKGLIIGDCCEEHGKLVEKMWGFIRAPIYHVTQEEASIIKLSSNNYAAMLISFWNNLKIVCDKLNININDVSRILPLIDERVSKYGTLAGAAYGGTCLPKDVKQFINMCKNLELNTDLFEAVEGINSWYKESTISRGGL